MRQITNAAVVFSVIVIALLLLAISAQAPGGKRVYQEGEQFPKGSEHLMFPPTAQFSIFMGEMK
jgi:hypothetical protein